jgi:hypothetical protein
VVKNPTETCCSHTVLGLHARRPDPHLLTNSMCMDVAVAVST